MLFHYGEEHEVLPWPSGPVDGLNYPLRCVSDCLDAERLPEHPRGLDLGCAVGRSTFELARHCAEVIGIDGSAQFIKAAEVLRTEGTVDYSYVEEGHLTKATSAVVPEDIDRQRVMFEVGDAQALRADLGHFDVVLMANLLDRLEDPRACLRGLPALIKPGGQLIISTPCTWMEEYTPEANWLGGFLRKGSPVRTLDTLRETLMPHFKLLQVRDLPFLIREHSRKFQWSVAQASTWIRKADADK